MPGNRPWTPDEDTFLKKHYRRPAFSTDFLGDIIDRSAQAVRHRAGYLGLSTPPDKAEPRPLPPAPIEIPVGPTHELPGTPAKREILAARAAAGLPLFHDDDAGYSED